MLALDHDFFMPEQSDTTIPVANLISSEGHCSSEIRRRSKRHAVTALSSEIHTHYYMLVFPLPEYSLFFLRTLTVEPMADEIPTKGLG